MNQKQDDTRLNVEARTAQKTEEKSKKKKYSKPALLYQAPLEAMAAVCTGQFGKASGICAVANS
jgi:hypothetical protein